MAKFGIMQSRLSPSQDGRLQFFPKDWQKEFPIAKQLGFDCIEWVWDWDDRYYNPIEKNIGSEMINKIVEESGTPVHSICADYFMKNRLTRNAHEKISRILRRAAVGAFSSRIKLIGIPILEEFTIKTLRDKIDVFACLTRFLKDIDGLGIELALETELPGDELREFIEIFDDARIGACYDTGNLITLGHDLPRDIRLLGKMIKQVHLKDRKVGSTQSVYLGEGDVNFEECFRALHDIGFDGLFVLQAWRGEDYIGDAKRQLDFVKEIWTKTGG
ncbi:MAG: sugar phosphate isomerase/epimerase family protein [bacterium]|nr:sugar phosphate isomerase/epimerase family protein [bacterium]